MPPRITLYPFDAGCLCRADVPRNRQRAFQTNVSTMVGNLYPEGSHLKDRAYNIFYMDQHRRVSRPVVMEVVKQKFGNHPAFAVAAFGMVISVGILWKFRSTLKSRSRRDSRSTARRRCSCYCRRTSRRASVTRANRKGTCSHLAWRYVRA